MYWTLELASSLDDAPWPATKEELIDYANRSGAPEEVIETWKSSKKKARSTRRSKTSGPTTLPRTISFSTRKSIKRESYS